MAEDAEVEVLEEDFIKSLGKPKATKALVVEVAPKKVAGRPRKKIDYEVVEDLASKCFSREAIARTLKVSKSLLAHDELFVEAYKRGREKMAQAVEAALFDSATKRNSVAAQIWLSKQYCNMSDHVDVRSRNESVVIVINKEDADV